MTTRGTPTDGRQLPSMTVVRELTDDSVLDVVFSSAPLTRAEIARATGISKPTVAESVRRLEAAGLLTAAGEQSGRQGRVGTLYAVADAAGHVIALDLGPVAVRVLVSDLLGRPLFEQALPPVTPRETGAVSRTARTVVRRALRQAIGHGPLRAASVSVANSVDPSTQRIVPLPDSPYPEGFIDVERALRGSIGTAELAVANDVNLAALAERAHGAAAGADDLAYFFVGAGLGVGLVLGGRLVAGAAGLAGEIGYLSASGEPDRHDLARTVSARGFGRTERRPDDPLAAAHELFAAAASGDDDARTAIDAQARTIGTAVAMVCAVVDPGLIVLGGPLGLHPELLEPVRAEAARLAPRPPRIVTGALGERAPLVGATQLALDHARRALLPPPQNAVAARS